jgi:hypothetical protein
MDIKAIQVGLGHSRLGTTADLYVSVMPQLRREMAAAIQSALQPDSVHFEADGGQHGGQRPSAEGVTEAQ